MYRGGGPGRCGGRAGEVLGALTSPSWPRRAAEGAGSRAWRGWALRAAGSFRLGRVPATAGPAASASSAPLEVLCCTQRGPLAAPCPALPGVPRCPVPGRRGWQRHFHQEEVSGVRKAALSGPGPAGAGVAVVPPGAEGGQRRQLRAEHRALHIHLGLLCARQRGSEHNGEGQHPATTP